MSLNAALSAAQARVIIERLAVEPLLDSPTAADLVAAAAGEDWNAIRALFSRATAEEILRLPERSRIAVAHHMAMIAERVEASVARDGQGAAELRRSLEILRTGRERERADQAEVVAGSVGTRPLPEPAPQVAEPLPGPRPPGRAYLMSEVAEPFFRAKRYEPHSEHQNRATLRLWNEIIGDKRTSEYTREDAFAFQDALRQLPNSHGKGQAKHALKAIADSKGKDVDRLTDRTIRRHFSVLKQLWEHLGEEVTSPAIFAKIKHDVEDGGRQPWSVSDLNKLLRGRWNPKGQRGNRTSEETHAWLVAMGAYTGCRVEELARVRLDGIETIEGVPCFAVATHITKKPGRRATTSWKPKTAAGVRSIPIHQKLLDAGFMELVESRRGHEQLFELTASGLNMKLSTEYSRKFSRFKIDDLDVGPETVFHSFRHNVETILVNKNQNREWIDVFLGHASGKGRGERKSVGLVVYFHGLELAALQEVARAVEYPPEVEPTLLLRRVRGEVPW